MEAVFKPVRKTVYAIASLTSNMKSLESQSTYVYDDIGNLLKETVEWYSGNYGCIEIEYSYDIYGRKNGEKRTEYDGILNKVICSEEESCIYYPDRREWRIHQISQKSGRVITIYDGIGRPIIDYDYDKDGRCIPRHEFFYEGTGINASTINYYNNGVLVVISRRRYDPNGNILWLQEVEPDGNICGRITYRYNHQGERIERRSYNADGKLTHWEKRRSCIQVETRNVYPYNLQREVIEDIISYDYNGGMFSKSLYKKYYDQNGNLVYSRYIECIHDKTIEITDTEFTYGLVRKATINSIHPIDPSLYTM